MTRKTPFGEYEEGGIYHHYKDKYYKIVCVGKLHDSHNIFLISYYLCDINGIYQRIVENEGQPNESIVHQPFVTHETRWSDEVEYNGTKRKRFELVK